MNGITIYEFDRLIADGSCATESDTGQLHRIPDKVYDWLENQCLRAAETGGPAWLRLTQRQGRRVVQVTSYVGVIRSPDGFQIEVLPKVGKAIGGGAKEARQLLIEMLCCLQGFRHVQTESAKISAARMPLLEVFVAEFLHAITRIVRRGLRGDYVTRQGHLSALRGKLLIGPQLRHNLHRADRFFTQHDEFSVDRPENRLLRAALRRVLSLSASRENQQMARELDLFFAEVALSTQPQVDFQRARLDRGMNYYANGLAWARLILNNDSPLTGKGDHRATSLLFPMEAVFEAFVAKHLAKELVHKCVLKTQVQTHYLARHCERSWFRLKPDLVIQESGTNRLVLDTKWKLLGGSKVRGVGYGLDQADFYQLHTYGHSYLSGRGDLVLIYPKTDDFARMPPVFEVPMSEGLRIWIVPFCLKDRRLVIPANLLFDDVLKGAPRVSAS